MKRHEVEATKIDKMKRALWMKNDLTQRIREEFPFMGESFEISSGPIFYLSTSHSTFNRNEEIPRY